MAPHTKINKRKEIKATIWLEIDKDDGELLNTFHYKPTWRDSRYEDSKIIPVKIVYQPVKKNI